jgi:hypothetical protein
MGMVTRAAPRIPSVFMTLYQPSALFSREGNHDVTNRSKL